jgi:hypothetical protein
VPFGAAACARSVCPALTELVLTPGASPLCPRPMVRMEPLILQRLMVTLSARDLQLCHLAFVICPTFAVDSDGALQLDGFVADLRRLAAGKKQRD